MASESIDKGAREIQRYKEKNVYTRKAFRGSKNKIFPHTTTTDTTTTTATVTADGAKDNENNVSVQQPARGLALEDGNSALPVENSRLDVVSEDSLRLNHGQSEHFRLNVELEDATGSLEPSLIPEDGNSDNENNVSVQEPVRVLAPEDGNSALPVENSRLDVVSEDSLRLNHGQGEHFSLNVELEDATGSLEPSLSGSVGKHLVRGLALEDGNSDNENNVSVQEPVQVLAPEDGKSDHEKNVPVQESVRVLAPEDGKSDNEKNVSVQESVRVLALEDGKSDNEKNVSVQEPVRVLAPEDGKSALPVENSSLDVVSEDSSRLNHGQGEHFSLNVELEDVTGSLEPSLRGCVGKKGLESGVKEASASRSKQETHELRKKLESKLDTVRSWVNRIEEKQAMVDRYNGNLNMSVDRNGVDGGGAKRTHSEVAFAGVARETSRPLRHLSVTVLQNSLGSVEKEKRTPKANQFYCNSEFLLAKDKFPPAESNKKLKLNGKKHGGREMGHGPGIGSKYFRSCSSLLEKLMKHKHGWVFNTPVNVEGLGLHDYFTIITHPMDLGTVKSRLSKNWYKSPKEFAEDVRLTFRNAMTYNPKGQDVHIMAEELSMLFEERWNIIESSYNNEMRYIMNYGPSISAPSPLSRKAPGFRPPPLDMRRILDRSESMTNPPKSMNFSRSARTPAPKKPKANDPHKRDMTFEEKQKLSTNLQSLPSDKLDAIVNIIKKRNTALLQHDDEIEVDIDSVDTETLWDLDRFVSNYKKSLSKYKRKAELANQARAEAEQIARQKSQAPPVIVNIPGEAQADERNIPSSVPVQGEIRVDNNRSKTSSSSSSSSSSSDSGSSSSDSDSDSSSASGSDAGSQ